jgi:hypothetical protein
MLGAFCDYSLHVHGFLYFNPAAAQLACVLNPSTFGSPRWPSPVLAPLHQADSPNAGFLFAKRSQKRTQSSLKVCVMFVRSTNPDDRVRRIRDLCARAAETEDPDEIKQIASQLRKELHEQMAYLKQMVAVHRSCIAWEAESDEDTES